MSIYMCIYIHTHVHRRIHMSHVSFHPWWYRQVKKALRKFNADLAMSSMLGSAVPSMRDVQVKCAWRNFLPSTESLIQR